jgi:hypothetical protein
MRSKLFIALSRHRENAALRSLLCCVLVLTGAAASAAADDEGKSCFNCAVRYAKDEIIAFDGFTLEFLGRRPQPTPANGQHVRLGDCYDFRVVAPAKTETICWSSGTGEIGPRPFRAGSRCLLLELRRSDTVGKLDDGQLVVREGGARDCGPPP